MSTLRIITLVLFGLSAMLAAAPTIEAQLPAGYQRDSTQLLPDSLREVRSRLSISVARFGRDSLERALIEYAESLVPPPGPIEETSRGFEGPNWTASFEAAKRRPGLRWWWLDWGGVLLPYALTGRSVTHYIERARFMSATDPLGGGDRRYTVSVTYTAKIRRPSRDSTAYEVELKLDFLSYCGPRCALSFSHARIVEFDKDGKPLRIRGDGQPHYIVS